MTPEKASLPPHCMSDHEVGGRTGFPAAPVERLQPLVGHRHDAVDDFAEAGQALVLHADDIGIVHRGRGDALGQQQFGLQFLAAETDDHDFAAEIRIARQILQGADRHGGAGRVDGDAAAIGMGHGHHVVDIGIFRQQLARECA